MNLTQTIIGPSTPRRIGMVLLLASGLFFMRAKAQTGEITKTPTSLGGKPNSPFTFSGAASLTTKGISFIPAFSLGKPAAIFDLSMGAGRFRFEPQFRFALNGKPWGFIFWFREKLVTHEHFQLSVGAHLGMPYHTITYTKNGETHEANEVNRYLAAEFAPTYKISRMVSVGVYYLYSHGLEYDATNHTHFLTLNASISNIGITPDVALKLNPQVYYLSMDQNHGFYASAAATLSHKKWPVSLGALFNQTISTQITGSKPFVWNVSVAYAFKKRTAS